MSPFDLLVLHTGLDQYCNATASLLSGLLEQSPGQVLTILSNRPTERDSGSWYNLDIDTFVQLQLDRVTNFLTRIASQGRELRCFPRNWLKLVCRARYLQVGQRSVESDRLGDVFVDMSILACPVAIVDGDRDF